MTRLALPLWCEAKPKSDMLRLQNSQEDIGQQFTLGEAIQLG